MKGTSGLPFVLLCVGSIICGILTVVAGPLLPVPATRWELRDAQSGRIFAVRFVFSTAAASCLQFVFAGTCAADSQ